MKKEHYFQFFSELGLSPVNNTVGSEKPVFTSNNLEIKLRSGLDNHVDIITGDNLKKIEKILDHGGVGLIYNTDDTYKKIIRTNHPPTIKKIIFLFPLDNDQITPPNPK
jgi:hypothetical protein